VIAAAVDPERARADARNILSGRQYRSDPAPRPLRGPLHWLGKRLEPIARFLGSVFDAVPWFVWVALGIALLAWVIWLFVRDVEGRKAPFGIAGRAGATAAAEREDPDALEREADDAERTGDYERAVRLRFRAGLLRLGARGTIEYQPSITTIEVRRALDSPTFDALAETFDEITYGGRDAVEPDAVDARARWPELLGGRR
jgi:hypothetical protein